MNDNPDPRPSGNVISLRLEGEFADEVDRIAQEDGCSRSEVLRRMLLGNLEREGLVTVRWIRRLQLIEGQLADLLKIFEDAEAWDAAQPVEGAIESIAEAIDELEGFETEDE